MSVAYLLGFNTLENRLQQLREEKNLTKEDLSQVLKAHGKNVSVETITKWENGTLNIDEDLLDDTSEILADYFNVSIYYLKGMSDYRNASEAKDEDLVAYQKYIELGKEIVLKQAKKEGVTRIESNIKNRILTEMDVQNYGSSDKILEKLYAAIGLCEDQLAPLLVNAALISNNKDIEHVEKVAEAFSKLEG